MEVQGIQAFAFMRSTRNRQAVVCSLKAEAGHPVRFVRMITVCVPQFLETIGTTPRRDWSIPKYCVCYRCGRRKPSSQSQSSQPDTGTHCGFYWHPQEIDGSHNTVYQRLVDEVHHGNDGYDVLSDRPSQSGEYGRFKHTTPPIFSQLPTVHHQRQPHLLILVRGDSQPIGPS